VPAWKVEDAAEQDDSYMRIIILSGSNVSYQCHCHQ